MAVVARVIVITSGKLDEYARLVTYGPGIITGRQQHNIVFEKSCCEPSSMTTQKYGQH